MEMTDIIQTIYENVRLHEGISRLNAFLIHAWLREGQSVKEMALRLKLPVPVVAAIKNECKRHGVAASSNGIRLTTEGGHYVSEHLQFGTVRREKLLRVLDAPDIPFDLFTKEAEALEALYLNRPTADVTVDQSHCTAETGIRRALLMLRTGGLIGQRLFFAGDDDLTSVALWLVLNALSEYPNPNLTAITVMDIDERVLQYIAQTAAQVGGQVNGIRHDLRAPIPDEHKQTYDAVFTDPPYTLPGLRLFVSRGMEALKLESDLPIYLSCARKSPEIRLSAQRMFCDAGLVIERIYEGFNHYHGAQILGGVSDLTILATTGTSKPLMAGVFDEPIYTNEINRSTRIYQCKQCHTAYRVGHAEKISTVEILKEHGCADCGGRTFLLRERTTEQCAPENQKKRL